MDDDDDIYEVFDDIKKDRQKKRNDRLASISDVGWSKHTEHHWYMMLVDSFGMKHKLDYWPSSNKWCYMKRYYRGGLPKWIQEKVNAAIEQISR